jgi:hypothetical protein
MAAITRKSFYAATLIAAIASACSDNSNNQAPAADATPEGASEDATSVQDAGAPEGGQDAASLDSTVSDAPYADAPSADAATDAEAGDGGPTPPFLLQAGTSFVLGGVTSDDWVIYYDSSSQTYYARHIDGGPITTLYTVAPSLYGGYITVIGKVAFGFGWNGSYQGPLWSWTSGMSQAATLTNTGLAYLYQTDWASDDGQYVAYLGGNSLYGANVDGSNATLLASNLDTNTSFSGASPGCFPRCVFRGDIAVVSYCAVDDAGGLTPTIQSFSANNGWAASVVVTNWVDSYMYNPLDRRSFTFPFAVDPDGGMVVAAAGSGILNVLPIDGGPGSVIDPNTVLSQGQSFAGTPSNPWNIVYNDDAGVLKQAYAADASAQTLVDGGANYFNSISHDGRWMLVSNQRNSSGWFADLSLVSTVTPGAPQLVASSSLFDGGPVTPSAQRYGGNGFTADDKFALMFTNVTRSYNNIWIGYVRAMSVAPPYTTRLVSNGYAYDVAPIKGSKVLLVDGFQDTDGGAGSVATLDLDVVDLATSAPAVKIASAGPAYYGFSNDRSKIVYVVKQIDAPGIYVTPVP